MSSNIVLIDSRVVGFSHVPIRILSACIIESGIVQILGEKPFIEFSKQTSEKYRTIVVTDSPEIVQDWNIAFDPKKHLDDVINIYQLRQRAGLIQINDDVMRYNPEPVLQVRKLDKNGLVQEFDSGSVENGHIAVLLAVWATYKVKLNHDCLTPSATEKELVDSTLIPFTI